MTEWDAELDAAVLAESEIMQEIRDAPQRPISDAEFEALVLRAVAASQRVQAALHRRLQG